MVKGLTKDAVEGLPEETPEGGLQYTSEGVLQKLPKGFHSADNPCGFSTVCPILPYLPIPPPLRADVAVGAERRGDEGAPRPADLTDGGRGVTVTASIGRRLLLDSTSWEHHRHRRNCRLNTLDQPNFIGLLRDAHGSN